MEQDMREKHVAALTALAIASTPNEVVTALHAARQILGVETETWQPLLESLIFRANEVTQLRELAGLDELTGVANRRVFDDTVAREVARYGRTGQGFSLVLLDLDGLKELNDALGHAAGDLALITLARACVASLRTTDLVARLGGDEFALLVADATREGAAVVAKRIRSAIEAQSVEGVNLRVSVGTATADGNDPVTVEFLFEEADAALYTNKRERRGDRARSTIPAAARRAVDPNIADQLLRSEEEPFTNARV